MGTKGRKKGGGEERKKREGREGKNRTGGMNGGERERKG